MRRFLQAGSEWDSVWGCEGEMGREREEID